MDQAFENQQELLLWGGCLDVLSSKLISSLIKPLFLCFSPSQKKYKGDSANSVTPSKMVIIFHKKKKLLKQES